MVNKEWLSVFKKPRISLSASLSKASKALERFNKSVSVKKIPDIDLVERTRVGEDGKLVTAYCIGGPKHGLAICNMELQDGLVFDVTSPRSIVESPEFIMREPRKRAQYQLNWWAVIVDNKELIIPYYKCVHDGDKSI